MKSGRVGILLAALMLPMVSAVAQNAVGPANGSLGMSNGGDNVPAGPSRGNAPPMPVPTTYVVGESDVLRINVWKQPEISQQSVVVRPDGMVSMPLIGEIKVSGMTPVQIESMLVSDLKQYVNEPRVTVTVTEVGSKTVYVTGEVQHPGAYPLVAPIDVLQLIAKAGGVTPFAHRRSMFVLRDVNGKKQKVSVNYSKIFRGKSPEQNISLQPGDTVVVP